MRLKISYSLVALSALFGCQQPDEHRENEVVEVQDTIAVQPAVDTIVYDDPSTPYINTGQVQPSEVVKFAETLKGIPYSYACSSPSEGFDCSGFINYVFDHFDIQVPRSSKDFTNVGKEVSQSEAQPGDLILFTGTNKEIRVVGHLGIVIYHHEDSLSFIHSSSGSANSVTVTPLNDYYKGRFMKVIRIFKQNEAFAANR